MKSLTKWVLGAISTIGVYLVGEGLITGEELSAMQNVLGMALAGGGISIGLVIAIIQAIPKELVNAGYEKAVDTYTKEKVDNILNNIDEFKNILATTQSTVEEVKALLEEAKAERQELLSE